MLLISIMELLVGINEVVVGWFAVLPCEWGIS
jgi:hypothetical protein